MRPFAWLDSTCMTSLLIHACDRIQSPRLARPLVDALSIIQLRYGCSSLYSLVPKPAFNLHAGMPVESKPSEYMPIPPRSGVLRAAARNGKTLYSYMYNEACLRTNAVAMTLCIFASMPCQSYQHRGADAADGALGHRDRHTVRDQLDARVRATLRHEIRSRHYIERSPARITPRPIIHSRALSAITAARCF